MAGNRLEPCFSKMATLRAVAETIIRIGTYKTKGDGAVFHIEINQFGKKADLGQKSEKVGVVVGQDDR